MNYSITANLLIPIYNLPQNIDSLRLSNPMPRRDKPTQVSPIAHLGHYIRIIFGCEDIEYFDDIGSLPKTPKHINLRI